MNSKNICVVGAGYWGKNHLRILNDLGALSGIVEKNKEVLEEILKQYPNIKGFASIDESLNDESFNGYTIATPAETHFDLARKVIRSKKHVWLKNHWL